MKNDPGGLILLNKPPGVTSFNALNNIKKTLQTGKVGHTGTLDKFASGLIVALTGKMTKLVPDFTGMDKRYEALIRFGEETETLDPEGVITERASIPDFLSIESVIPRFKGKIKQIPPVYSAIHIDGRRAYERARTGEDVKIPEREIEIFSLEILDWKSPHLSIAVHCSKGTYIRSLARDISRAAGSCGHLRELKRTSVGPFTLDNAVSAEQFSREEHLFPPHEVFASLSGIDSVVVDEKSAMEITVGKENVLRNLAARLKGSNSYALFSENGDFLALVHWEKGRLKYRFVC
jgi:tRNA pseudouridine55 synthase